jgi:AcrR family transcriptional regulator
MTYQSPKMVARRKRILRTAQALIAAKEGSFTMTELAEASEVAERTLYNLFGRQDALLAEAVTNVFRERLDEPTERCSTRDIVEATNMRNAAAFAEMMRVPGYSKTMARIYFASKAGSEVRDILHEGVGQFWANELRKAGAKGELHRWVEPERLAGEIVTSSYAALLRWADGELTDQEMMDRIEFVTFALLASGLRGESHELVMRALQALSDNRKGARAETMAADQGKRASA